MPAKTLPQLVDDLAHAKGILQDVLVRYPAEADGTLDLEQAIAYIGQCQEWIAECDVDGDTDA